VGGTRPDVKSNRGASARAVSLGKGIRVPYPQPSSAAASSVAKGNRRTDTKPEIELRSQLHRAGLRFRKNVTLRLARVRVQADIVFPRERLAVFVDGCFWHGCPEHGRVPRTNVGYWEPKLEANIRRDERTTAALVAAGWSVVRVWEHDAPADSASRIVAEIGRLRRDLLRSRRPEPN
jgi:DNA mismatch endonuclease, patch repair protein